MSTIPARDVEVLTAFGIGALLLAVSTALGLQLKASAALSEVHSRIRSAQLDDVEHFALTGQWPSSGGSVNAPLAKDVGEDRLSSELTQLRIAFRSTVLQSAPELPALTGKALPALGTRGNQHSRPTAIRSGVVDGAIVLVGRFGDGGSTFSWLARPAVQRNDTPMVAAWVCGRAEPGPAWVAAALPPGADRWQDTRSAYWCPSEVLQ